MSFSLEAISVHHTGADRSRFALSDVTLSIQQGEQLALIGPSGAGKTTLLHTLACAVRPEQGRLRVFGQDPWARGLSSAARHTMRARLFLAPQTPPMPPRQRVVNAVLAGMLPQWTTWQALRSLLKPIAPEKAYQALARFHLQDKLYARVDRLSGGERQRCGMARALLSQAEAFLVDEPLSALDPNLAVQTLTVLQEEARQRGASLICSLHQVELARAHFPRIIGLRDGRVMFDAQASEISDAMIADLYRNASNTNDADTVQDDHSMATELLIPRC